MKVSLLNSERPVVNGLNDCNTKGKLILEVLAETETERSLLRGLEPKEGDIRISVGDEGHCLYIYHEEKK